MTATTTDQIARERDGTTEALWVDFDLLWAQYQSWQEHNHLLAESQDKLNMTAPDMASDLKRLLGDNADLEMAGEQLHQALTGLVTELDRRKSTMTPDQEKKLTQIKIRLGRERELRVFISGSRL